MHILYIKQIYSIYAHAHMHAYAYVSICLFTKIQRCYCRSGRADLGIQSGDGTSSPIPPFCMSCPLPVGLMQAGKINLSKWKKRRRSINYLFTSVLLVYFSPWWEISKLKFWGEEWGWGHVPLCPCWSASVSVATGILEWAHSLLCESFCRVHG